MFSDNTQTRTAGVERVAARRASGNGELEVDRSIPVGPTPVRRMNRLNQVRRGVGPPPPDLACARNSASPSRARAPSTGFILSKTLEACRRIGCDGRRGEDRQGFCSI